MLAERIGVSASTASESIRKLADQGLVDHEKYGAVTLTDAGRQGRAGDGAPAPADGDVPGARARLRLGRGARRGRGARARRLATGCWTASTPSWATRQRDPHGDPIPAADGQVPTPPARQLSVCEDGDTGTVARISDADPEMLRYFDSVGITLDSRLRVLARRDFAGMISVAIKSADAGRTIRAPPSIWAARPQRRSGSSVSCTVSAGIRWGPSRTSARTRG